MSKNKITKDILTSAQFKTYSMNSKTLQYYRANPVVACEQLLGISLLDYQAYTLQNAWNSQFSILCMSRNASKSFLGAIIMMLTALLYENQKIWIVAPVGSQSKETFSYITRIAKNELEGFENLSDIFYNEIERANDSLSGFSLAPEGHSVKLLNGSMIKTLNGNPANIRSKRATMVYFDETGWLGSEMVSVAEAFATGNSSFVTSTDKYFNPLTLNERKPNQLIYASSASDKTTDFYQKYQMFAKRMWAGDRRYFAIDIKVDIPLNPTKKGKQYPPLLDKSKPQQALATNPVKAMREYWNSFEETSEDQIVSSHAIEKNSKFLLPDLYHKKGSKYGLFYDPARTADNSALLIGEFIYSEKIGWYGRIVNLVNFKDLGQLKGNVQMMYPEQIKQLRHYLTLYNGDSPDYENIIKFGVDTGSGGGGILYLDELLFSYKDKYGNEHRGIIDKEYHTVEVQKQFPNASNIVRMVEPTKNRNMLFESMISMFDLGLVELPFEYNNSGHIVVENENGENEIRNLSKEEELALINIDLMKSEIKMIHRYVTPHGNTVYKVRTDMANRLHDDRAYVCALFCNELRILRENDLKNKHIKHKPKDKTVLRLFN